MGLDHFCIPFLLNQDLLKSSQQNYIPFLYLYTRAIL